MPECVSDAEAYTRIPYPGLAFPQTHPDRLALLAILHGLEPAPPDARPRAGGRLRRRAEPGRDGGPLARAVRRSASTSSSRRWESRRRPSWAWPTCGSSRPTCSSARDWGEFDYVVAHGVYAWVPDAARDALMALFARCLAPHGVAFVSYNALPGARLRTMLREMVLLHAGERRPGCPSASTPGASCTSSSRLGGGPAGRLRRGAGARARAPAAAAEAVARPRRPRPPLRPRLAARRRAPRRAPRPALSRRRRAGRAARRPPAAPAWTRSSTPWPAATASSGSSTPTCSPAGRSARRCCAAPTRRSTTRSRRRGCSGCGSARPRAPSSTAARRRRTRARRRTTSRRGNGSSGPVGGRAARARAPARVRVRRAARALGGPTPTRWRPSCGGRSAPARSSSRPSRDGT